MPTFIKETLRPTLPKLLMTVALLFLTSYLWKITHVVHDASFFGFPLPVAARNDMCLGREMVPDCGRWQFSLITATLDFGFWLIVSGIVFQAAKKAAALTRGRRRTLTSDYRGSKR